MDAEYSVPEAGSGGFNKLFTFWLQYVRIISAIMNHVLGYWNTPTNFLAHGVKKQGGFLKW